MLAIDPLHWYSWDFAVSQAGRRIAEIGLSWREHGRLTVNGLAYTVRRERMLGEFRLESPGGGTIATAVKPSLFRRAFAVTHGANTWTMRRQSLWSRRIQVLEGDREIGHVTRNSWWSYRASAALPDAMPVPVQVFCVWLGALIWKREADAHAGSA